MWWLLPIPALPSSYSRFRQVCQSIIAHKLFDYVVLAFIFSNCITVALERPKILQGSLVSAIICMCNKLHFQLVVFVWQLFVFFKVEFSFIITKAQYI